MIIIDVKGIVVYDFWGCDVGCDNLCWNDVYCMLCGEYGVCFSLEILGDDIYLVMYVVVLILDLVDGCMFIGVFSLV